MSMKISAEEKQQAVKEYLSGKGSCEAIAKKYGVARSSFRKWIAKYKAFGESAFIKTGNNVSILLPLSKLLSMHI